MVKQIVPFKAEHLLELVPRDPFDEALLDSAWHKEHDGPAFTAVVDGKVVACAGVELARPGVGFAWTVFGDAFPTHKLWVTGTIKRALRDIIRGCNLHRVAAHVIASNTLYRKWIELFGFEPECVMEHYTADAQDMVLYVWLRYKIRLKHEQNGDSIKITAFEADKVVGYTLHDYANLPSGYAALGHYMWVDPAYRGRGIGEKLHRERLRIAKLAGAKHFVGFATNHPEMITLMQKCGARPPFIESQYGTMCITALEDNR